MPIEAGASVGPDIGIYTFRGIMLGPIANYDVDERRRLDGGVPQVRLHLRPTGSALTDILQQPRAAQPRLRRVAAQPADHARTCRSNGDINWSSDSEVIRDFHSKEFVPVQEPDNYLEAVYTGRRLLRLGLHPVPARRVLPGPGEAARDPLRPAADRHRRRDLRPVRLERRPPGGEPARRRRPPRERPLRHVPRAQPARSRTRASSTSRPSSAAGSREYWDTDGGRGAGRRRAAPWARSASTRT